MSLYAQLKGVSLGLILTLCCACAVAAQQEPTRQEGAPESAQREGWRRPRRGAKRNHKMMGMMRALRNLNLTDAQAEQARAIFERSAESTRPQREALQQLHSQYGQGASNEAGGEQARQLRREIRESMQQALAEVMTILTPEQRAQFEQMKQERKARHEERRGRRRAERENEQ